MDIPLGYQNWAGDNGLDPMQIDNYHAYQNAMNNNSRSALFDFPGFGWLSSLVGSLFSLGSNLFTNRKNENLMRELWNREDTAYQRKVEDLKKAGLNPNFALGSGSQAGPMVSMTSPAANFGGDVAQAFDLYLDNVSQKIALDNSHSLNILRYARLEAQEIANNYAPDVAQAKLQKLREELEMLGFKNDVKEIDFAINKLTQLSNSASKWVKPGVNINRTHTHYDYRTVKLSRR